MTECNHCGACCNPVVTPISQADVLFRRVIPDPVTADWILNKLTPIPYKEGMRGRADMFRGDGPLVDEDGEPVDLFFYSCSNWSESEHRCMDYDNRPPTCAGYPWYGRPPNPAAALPDECSFREDIPVKLRRK